MSIRTKNILTALLAVVLVGGFIFAAEGLKDDKKDDRLEAIENATTTTVRRTTTTRKPTTTSSSLVLSTTTTSAVAPSTTIKATTTTRGSTTATTKKPTTTTTRPTPPANGTQGSDNTGTFVRNADGSISGSSVPACASSDAFCLTLGASQGSEGRVRLIVQLRNNTNSTARFPVANAADCGGAPNGLRISVTVNKPGNSVQTFVLDACSVTNLSPAGDPKGLDAVQISSQTAFTEVGEFNFQASCPVSFG